MALAVSLAAPVASQRPGTVEVGVFGRGSLFDPSLDEASALGFGGRVAVFLGERWLLEADMSTTSVDGLASYPNLTYRPFHVRLNFEEPYSEQGAPPGVPITVEVEDDQQLEAALAAGVTHILADNQPPDRVAAWAHRAGPGVTIQASGGITPETARPYAEAGATLISVGALTHSVPAAPLRCEIAVAR